MNAGSLATVHVNGRTLEGRVIRVLDGGRLVIDRDGFMRAGTTRYFSADPDTAHPMAIQSRPCCRTSA